MSIQSYRPHNPGHDYYDAGIYLITLVVCERKGILSTLNDNPRLPEVRMSEVGEAVCKCWDSSMEIQRKKGNDVESLGQIAMPDHWHAVIKVNRRMSICLGSIIQSFKSACTSRWRSIQGLPSTQEVSVLPLTARADLPQWVRWKAQKWKSEGELIRHLSAEERREYYTLVPDHSPHPLFDDNYDDTICMSERQRTAMVAYVKDNPRRAIMRRCYPQFMERRMHVIIEGRDYAAFGNLFLLRWARKIQVFCHRKARYGQLTQEERQKYGYTYDAGDELVTSVPYENTIAFHEEGKRWMENMLEGATVLVTPGISRGELTMKKLCIEQGLPLIHLQKEPIGKLWKPERSRFEACANGTLLILAPWELDKMSEVGGVSSTSDFSRFHNLNALAREICDFNGSARIVEM